MILISDLVKDCIDAMRCTKETIDHMVAERYRISALSHGQCDAHTSSPPLFRYSALDGGAHSCIFCDSPTAANLRSLGTLPTYPSHYVVVCEQCRECIA